MGIGNRIARPGWVVACGLLLSAAVPARAGEGEERVFKVTVDGKPGGTYRMTCRVAADGTETVTVAADVKLRVLVVNYTYTLRATEVWKDGKLVSLESKTDDDGKKKEARVETAADGGLTVAGSGGPRRTTRANLLVSTGWHAPAAGGTTARVMEVEDGTETEARIDPLGRGEAVAGGRAVGGPRYRLTGRNLNSEWWFDDGGRPIRQTMKTDGHTVTLELVEIRK